MHLGQIGVDICQASHSLGGDLGIYFFLYILLINILWIYPMKVPWRTFLCLLCLLARIPAPLQCQVLLSSICFSAVTFLFISLVWSSLLLFPLSFQVSFVCVFQIPLNHLTGMSRENKGNYVFNRPWRPKRVCPFSSAVLYRGLFAVTFFLAFLLPHCVTLWNPLGYSVISFSFHHCSSL